MPASCGRARIACKRDTASRKLTPLHEFTAPMAEIPAAALIIDSRGAPYGTTSTGGASGFGTVAKLGP
jgi:hypothetical protein